MEQYAIIGNPIQHSLSPYIHQLFAQQTLQALNYSAILVAHDNLKNAIDSFQSQQGKGLNVTLPFKTQALQWMDQLTPRAQQAQAINTIKFNEDGTRLGDNTDGIGLINDLTKNHSFNIKNKNILILGAGGATQGILHPLQQQQPANITIANRTKKIIDNRPTCDFADLKNQSFDLIIHATSANLLGEQLFLPEGIIHSQTFCYDLSYGKTLTPFLTWAQNAGARIADGFGMLVEQAAEAFYLWRGVRPDTSLIIHRR